MSEYSVSILMKNSTNNSNVERVLVSGVSSVVTLNTTEQPNLNRLANRYQAITTDSLRGDTETPYAIVIEKRDTLLGGQGTVTVEGPGVDYLETEDVVQTKYINTTDGKQKTINITHPSTPESESTEDIQHWQQQIRNYVAALIEVAPTLNPTTANLKYTKTVTEFPSSEDG